MANFFKKLFHHRDNDFVWPADMPIVDYHCHILPGVDDGVKTIDDALSILKYYERMGFSEVYLTPHIMEDFPNTPASLSEVFDQLCQQYTGNITLHLAAENMMDGLFMKRLEKGEVLPLKDNMLLVETSYYNPPIGLYDILDTIAQKGYQPVLAHPERYVYMGENDYDKLIDQGVLLQLNMLSLKGLYGKDAMKKAAGLCKKNAYSFIGSDLHRPLQLQHVEDALSSPQSAKLISQILMSVKG